MNAQELKNSILQRAIEGKLVPQRADEGNARELLAEIKAEKEQLIKEKKIKRTKPLPEITDEEKPFEIPENWEWVRLGEISSYAQTKNKISAQDIQDDMWSLDMEDIEKDTGRIIRVEQAKNKKIAGDKVLFQEGDILYSKLRPYLKKILVAPKNGICTSELVPFTCYGDISNLYITWFLRSPYVNRIVNSVSYGVKMPRVSKDTMIMLVVPLPPLAEQRRIVAKIEEFLPLIEQYDKAYTKLSTLNAKFPEQMKKSLLQYAMEGRLVPQHAEDGTAEELLQEIQAEKTQLIKEKKIKKTKSLPAITDDEKPFEIPKSWKWVRLGDIFLFISTGPFGTMLHKADYSTQGTPLVNPININHGIITPSDNKKVNDETLERLSSYKLKVKDMVFARRGELGRCAIVTSKEDGWLCGTGSFFAHFGGEIEPRFMYMLFQTLFVRQQLLSNSVGTTMSNLNRTSLASVVVPLPPLAEQHRIVARLEELLPYCTKLSQ